MKQVFRRWMEKMHLKKHENATKEAEKKKQRKTRNKGLQT